MKELINYPRVSREQFNEILACLYPPIGCGIYGHLIPVNFHLFTNSHSHSKLRSNIETP